MGLNLGVPKVDRARPLVDYLKTNEKSFCMQLKYEKKNRLFFYLKCMSLACG
jgi:hypothetical protein